ncbi:hypothetical protein CBR_g37534 [Chara braunii]|uniref:Uncharacterized protein n=1 Tax=Chara braunii TaxID=69332 RepID=A0A388LND9_CHABU|nr:hypothetical protein CBR_g37534 [Chara braunii]|eukprot:GBG83733.1 hypothetical protein CBR_g37534 [Chara braunii]
MAEAALPGELTVVVSSLLQLKYLDDRPVFENERLRAEAWARGGVEAEREAIANLQAMEEEKQRRQMFAMRMWRKESSEKRRVLLGLSPRRPMPVKNGGSDFTSSDGDDKDDDDDDDDDPEEGEEDPLEMVEARLTEAMATRNNDGSEALAGRSNGPEAPVLTSTSTAEMNETAGRGGNGLDHLQHPLPTKESCSTSSSAASPSAQPLPTSQSRRCAKEEESPAEMERASLSAPGTNHGEEAASPLLTSTESPFFMTSTELLLRASTASPFFMASTKSLSQEGGQGQESLVETERASFSASTGGSDHCDGAPSPLTSTEEEEPLAAKMEKPSLSTTISRNHGDEVPSPLMTSTERPGCSDG